MFSDKFLFFYKIPFMQARKRKRILLWYMWISNHVYKCVNTKLISTTFPVEWVEYNEKTKTLEIILTLSTSTR